MTMPLINVNLKVAGKYPFRAQNGCFIRTFLAFIKKQLLETKKGGQKATQERSQHGETEKRRKRIKR